jgi:hypothetical protein
VATYAGLRDEPHDAILRIAGHLLSVAWWRGCFGA